MQVVIVLKGIYLIGNYAAKTQKSSLSVFVNIFYFCFTVATLY